MLLAALSSDRGHRNRSGAWTLNSNQVAALVPGVVSLVPEIGSRAVRFRW
jgi:hypothetical protein